MQQYCQLELGFPEALQTEVILYSPITPSLLTLFLVYVWPWVSFCRSYCARDGNSHGLSCIRDLVSK